MTPVHAKPFANETGLAIACRGMLMVVDLSPAAAKLLFPGSEVVTVLSTMVVATVALAAEPAADMTSKAASIRSEMIEAGFASIDEMNFGERDVRRVRLVDPYGFLPLPGIEIERHADGRLTLRAQYRGWTGPHYSLTNAEWEKLAALERSAFARPGKSQFVSKPGVVVHCWSGTLEATPHRVASWWACDPATKPAFDYTFGLLTLAMAKQGCTEEEKDPLWRFSKCFAVGQKLDNGALQAAFQQIKDDWTKQREPGADILADARVALRTAREDPSTANLAAAQVAVLAFGHQQDKLGDILQKSFAVIPSQKLISRKDQSIVEQLRGGWTQDIAAQTRNYEQLLEELTELLSKRLKARAPS